MPGKKEKHTVLQHTIPKRCHKRTFGQRLADELATKAGSWGFIVGFFLFLIFWMCLNTYLIFFGRWDPYPFILLNLVLSCLAAIQAPIILMSQNRAAEIDRQRAANDYYVNRKAEKEIKILQRDILQLKAMISRQPKAKEIEKIEQEIKKIQADLELATSTVYE